MVRSKTRTPQIVAPTAGPFCTRKDSRPQLVSSAIRLRGASTLTISRSTPIGSEMRCSAAKQHTASNAPSSKGSLSSSACMYTAQAWV